MTRERLDELLGELATTMGGTIRGWTVDPSATEEQVIDGKIKHLEAYLRGDTRRIFMIDEDDENGWLHALEDAWNLADKANKPELADKLEAILEYYREQTNNERRIS